MATVARCARQNVLIAHGWARDEIMPPQIVLSFVSFGDFAANCSDAFWAFSHSLAGIAILLAHEQHYV